MIHNINWDFPEALQQLATFQCPLKKSPAQVPWFWPSSSPGQLRNPQIGGFHKWGYPQNGWFIRENPSINGWFGGTPIFRKPLYGWASLLFPLCSFHLPCASFFFTILFRSCGMCLFLLMFNCFPRVVAVPFLFPFATQSNPWVLWTSESRSSRCGHTKPEKWQTNPPNTKDHLYMSESFWRGHFILGEDWLWRDEGQTDNFKLCQEHFILFYCCILSCSL